jgi:hypothetical protein
MQNFYHDGFFPSFTRHIVARVPTPVALFSAPESEAASAPTESRRPEKRLARQCPSREKSRKTVPRMLTSELWLSRVTRSHSGGLEPEVTVINSEVSRLGVVC